MTDLKILAKLCNFGEQEASLIRDRVILGIKDEALKERLLRIPDLNLVTAVNQCRAAEVSKNQLRGLHENVAVDSITGHKNKKCNKNAGNVKNKDNGNLVNKNCYQCFKCGTTHSRGNCPAFGKTCNKCKKLNHYAVGCRYRNNTNKEPVNKKVNEMNESNKTDGSETENEIFEIKLDEVSTDNIKNEWFETVKINKTKIGFKIDTGTFENMCS